MKRLIALSLITALFISCGTADTDESSDLLDGILDSQDNIDPETGEEYEVPTSDGPTTLPTADNE